MNDVTFKDKEKIKMFDEITSHFYYKNFGSMSKADIELMMFNFYMKKLIEMYQDEDGILDYVMCSDYRIGKELGLTQSKVKNLKIKKQLIYPEKFDWEKSFVALTKRARYDKEEKTVSMDIPDPNLYYEVKNFIEENGGYVEQGFNTRVLKIRAEYYIDIIANAEKNEETRKEIIKRLRKEFAESGKDDTALDEKHIGKAVIKYGMDIVSILSSLSSVPGIGGSVEKLINTFLEEFK